jgi:hypothetical protein
MSFASPELYRRKVFNQKSFDLLWKFRDAISHEYKDSYKRHRPGRMPGRQGKSEQAGRILY